jgi:hypothetical protein
VPGRGVTAKGKRAAWSEHEAEHVCTSLPSGLACPLHQYSGHSLAFGLSSAVVSAIFGLMDRFGLRHRYHHRNVSVLQRGLKRVTRRLWKVSGMGSHTSRLFPSIM